MSSTATAEPAAPSRPDTQRRLLYVAWQDPDSRAFVPVGRLGRDCTDGEVAYEYRYLRNAERLERFRPFVGFPHLRQAYRSSELFPFFENRLMPRTRPDYPDFVGALGLAPDADPFEVLARSEGRRQTDTIEVFPQPELDDSVARCRFLVHGVRYVPGAQDAIDSLARGDRLRLLVDRQNPTDTCAVLLRDDSFRLLGWVPRYLTELVHTPLDHLGPTGVDVHVEHVGDRDGPVHLRLLCTLEAQWPTDWASPMSGPEFEVLPLSG